MKILITGATGKIGQRLTEQIKNLGHEIVVLVMENEARRVQGASVSVVVGNLLDKESLYKATENIDVVVHLAGITHTNNQKWYYDVNVGGTKNLLEASQKNQVKKFIFISSRTASVQGGAYAHSKLLAEEEVKKSMLPWIILRLSEVYGAGEKEAIARLARTIQKSKIVPIIGSGEYRLCPVYVDDVVSAIVSALENKSINKKIYTIAGPKDLSYNELADMLVAYFRVKRIKIHVPIFFVRFFAWIFYILKKNIIVRDQVSRLLCEKPSDISEARNDLDFQPRSFEEGIKKMRS